MNIFQSFFLGIVEGLTEFLPVSSTAHLILVSRWLHLSQNEFLKFFEVFIQSGAILAVVVLYLDYIKKHKYLLIKIGISFIPTAVIGFLLYSIIKNIFFESFSLIVITLITVGLGFIGIEYLISIKKIKLHKSLTTLTLLDAILTGFSQALAVIPGVSRSGIVMFYLMKQGYKRDEAAVYSFLLAVPTITMAAAYDLYKMKHIIAQSGEYALFIAIGFITSFFVAYAVMRWFIGFLRSNSLVPFGIYRLALAIIVLFI